MSTTPCPWRNDPAGGAVPQGAPSGTLLVIAKEPLPGRAKTRLTPPYSPQEAARLAEAALVDTLAVVALVPARRRVVVLDGAAGGWLPEGFEVAPQVGGGLDERLAAAFALADGPTLLVGMDTPQLEPDVLAAGLGRDCIGLARDGGFWVLGLRRPDPSLLLGVPMSQPWTGAVMRQRMVGAGLDVMDLPRLTDVDTAEDAAAVAAAAPGSRFAATWRALAGSDVSVPS